MAGRKKSGTKAKTRRRADSGAEGTALATESKAGGEGSATSIDRQQEARAVMKAAPGVRTPTPPATTTTTIAQGIARPDDGGARRLRSCRSRTRETSESQALGTTRVNSRVDEGGTGNKRKTQRVGQRASHGIVCCRQWFGVHLLGWRQQGRRRQVDDDASSTRATSAARTRGSQDGGAQQPGV